MAGGLSPGRYLRGASPANGLIHTSSITSRGRVRLVAPAAQAQISLSAV